MPVKLRRRIFKILILVSVAYATVMMWHWQIGFTFFTQLSNLFTAAVILAELIWAGKLLRYLKFAALVSITATGLVFLTVLAPMEPRGLLAAYAQDHCASLCLHLLTPALTLADFFVNDRTYPWRLRHVTFSLAPPAAWFLFILILGACGVRWGAEGAMTAPYPFLNYAAPAGWFGFVPGSYSFETFGIGVFYAILFMLLALFLLGLGLLALSRMSLHKSERSVSLE